MSPQEMRALLREIRFYDYEFKVAVEENSVPEYAKPTCLQASYIEPDIVTGEPERQYTRKWQLSEFMTKSEFVQTAFKCCITSMEHRAREHFRYQGHAVFGPHFDVDALLDLCKQRAFDYRAAA
jgi:hypothetical protein